jgi:uncharacterized protein with PIN domain
MIIVNSQAVDFFYRVRNGDRVSVYPVFESLDITGVTHLREKPLRKTRFILDVHLGKLARYLRLCGFDTTFSCTFSDTELIDLSVSDKRIIITRDRQLLKNKKVSHGYWIRSDNPQEQLRELFKRFDLYGSVLPFTRCMECNSLLEDVSKESIIDRLEARTSQFYNDYKICPSCNHIFWEGSHFLKMKEFIEKLIQSNTED